MFYNVRVNLFELADYDSLFFQPLVKVYKQIYPLNQNSKISSATSNSNDEKLSKLKVTLIKQKEEMSVHSEK